MRAVATCHNSESLPGVFQKSPDHLYDLVPFIHSANLLSAYYVPGIGHGPEDITVNKTDGIPGQGA